MKSSIFSFLLFSSTYQLSDSIESTGGSSSIPSELTAKGFESMFSKSTEQSTFSIGQATLFFLRFYSYDGGVSTGVKNYTAAFQVNVDDYSQLTIPASTALLVPKSVDNSLTAYRKMSILMYKTENIRNLDKSVTKRKTIICAPTPRNMWKKDAGNDFAVKSRQVLITVDQGVIVGCDWAPSNCIGQLGSYTLDSICADPCQGGGCKYNITMFVAWTGTDANGSPLRSYNRDLYRLQNAFQ